MPEISIDFGWFWEFASLPADQMILEMFFTVGWIPFAAIFLVGAKMIWIDYINDKWASKQKFILLAIDIPRENAQSPKAVENIFNYLAGAHGTFNLIELYWEGKYQLSISLEIVSIGGYTQFLVYAPAHIRDVVESAFYSQYPGAEINEVNDYTDKIPSKFPDDEYDVWGVEFNYKNKWAYPFKTYEEFIVQMGKPEEQFKDPMAALMDLCSSLKDGEQIWWQNIITPMGYDWMGEGEKEIKKILGEKDASKKNIADRLVDVSMGALDSMSEAVVPLWSDIDSTKSELDDTSLKMMNLKPIEKKKIEAISKKVSKTGYGFKSRFVYIAHKEVMNKPKAVNGFVGFMKQFSDLDLNNLYPEIAKTGTTASYFFIDKRLAIKKTKIVRNYINRSSSAGGTPGVINIEELATLWHFPVEAVVKAPLIQKASGRRSEPPASLPLDTQANSDEFKYNQSKDEDIFANLHDEIKTEEKSKSVVPDNLPFAR